MEYRNHNLYEDRSLLTALLDIYDCKKVLKEIDGSSTWWQAWNLHKLRVTSHKLLYGFGLSKRGKDGS